MPGPEPAPQIIFSNANLLPSPAAPTFETFRSATHLGEIVRTMGYDGVELHPLYHSAWHYGTAAANGNLPVASLHQSFRTAPAERDAFEDNHSLQARLVNGPLGGLLLPTMAESARWMGDVQTVGQFRVPGVFYPRTNAFTDRRNLANAETSVNLFQPTDQVAQQLGAGSVSRMLRLTEAHGYDGVCLDTYHVQRTYGSETPGPVSDLDNTLGILAAASRAAHLSLNRNDTAGEPHIETRRDLEVLLQSGEFVGRTADIMAALKEQSGGLRHVVVELTLGGLKEVTGHRKMRDHMRAYKEVGEATRAYFAAA